MSQDTLCKKEVYTNKDVERIIQYHLNKDNTTPLVNKLNKINYILTLGNYIKLTNDNIDGTQTTIGAHKAFNNDNGYFYISTDNDKEISIGTNLPYFYIYKTNITDNTLIYNKSFKHNRHMIDFLNEEFIINENTIVESLDVVEFLFNFEIS